MLRFFDLIITPDDTLKSALERMTANRKGLLFVCDHDAHLVGVISDGDVRRALVANAMLIARVETCMNLDPVIAQSIEEGRRLLARHNLLAIPVLNNEGRITHAVIQGVDDFQVIDGEFEDEIDTTSAQKMDTVALIPARGGSKRIPKKNIRSVAGKPLLSYAIETAQRVSSISNVIVSTDDIEIAEIARKHGAQVPWLRPPQLAQDNTPSIDVVYHAMEWARGKYGESLLYGVLLEPTAPLRNHFHIEEALEILRSSDADSVVSVCKLPHIYHPEELLILEGDVLKPYVPGHTMDNRLLRDYQLPVYVQNGLVYAFRVETMLKNRSLYGEKSLPMIVDWEYFLDIDVPSDLAIAEYKIRQFRQ